VCAKLLKSFGLVKGEQEVGDAPADLFGGKYSSDRTPTKFKTGLEHWEI
jgi:hypothetical protein